MTTLDIGAEPEAVLSTERTIPRHLVHRAAVAEVFLTDFQSVGERDFRASAQLPPDHSYYADRLGTAGGHDPLAVFEAVRQMLLCAMHLQHDAGPGTKSITAEAGLRITDPRPLHAPARPLDLDLVGRAALVKEYRGAVSRVVHEVDVAAAGRPIGTVRVDTALRPDDIYRTLRMSGRTTEPPSSDDLPAVSPARPIGPHLVGRTRADNVVLHDMALRGGELTALLRVPLRHPSMFDHPQDHVPGPVMMEAARQLGLLLAGERHGLAAAKLHLAELTAEYLRFAELDADIVLRSEILRAPAADGGGLAFAVAFEQGGEAVARMRVALGSTLGRAGAAGAPDGS
ncbi:MULTISPECIES: ScbA/BarX family gamma-butyrolactone biosynthesis protein [Streptomycetaceae]|uniref:ScbA/BarX family gamma-butyrolactone biosynthesis protein n=1 Tax=Streptomycetaceae TaxID=2062 RepID=UPI0030087FCE